MHSCARGALALVLMLALLLPSTGCFMGWALARMSGGSFLTDDDPDWEDEDTVVVATAGGIALVAGIIFLFSPQEAPQELPEFAPPDDDG